MFNNHVLYNKECINQTKSAYYSTMVCANDDSAKTPFSLFNSSFRSPDVFTCSSKTWFVPCSSSFAIPLPSHCFSDFQLPSVTDISDLICKSKPGQGLFNLFASPHICNHLFFTYYWNCSCFLQSCCHHPNIENKTKHKKSKTQQNKV